MMRNAIFAAFLTLITSLTIIASSAAFAADLAVQKTPQGKVLAVVSMNKTAVNQPLDLTRLKKTSAIASLNALNNYYYWGYRNDINKLLAMYTKKDSSWQRLSDKASKGKSPFVHFAKLDGVDVKEKYLWGDYQIFKVVWHTSNKHYNWLDMIYCNSTACQYSDRLLRFNDLESAVSGAINQAGAQVKVNKRGLQSYEFYPMGENRNPLTFHYNFTRYQRGKQQVWPLPPEANSFNQVSQYIAGIKNNQQGNNDDHKALAAGFWQVPGDDLDLIVPSYTYAGGAVKIQSYSAPALQQKILSFNKVMVIGQIQSINGRFILCQGLKSDASKELFFLPQSITGKFYIPNGVEDLAWSFVNTNPFANHLNDSINL
jgi:hypothetical protein